MTRDIKDCEYEVNMLIIDSNELYRINKELEQRIEDLEADNKELNLEIANIELKLHTGSYLRTIESPKTCEGCKYELYDRTSDYCYDCTRCGSQDYYESKDIE